jgi:hypothetical protein
MAMQYDVKSATRTTDGTMVSYRTRVKGMIISPTPGSAGTVVLKDGGSGGTALITINSASSTTMGPYPVVIPGEGVLFSTDVYLDLTDVTSVTVFYG